MKSESIKKAIIRSFLYLILIFLTFVIIISLAISMPGESIEKIPELTEEESISVNNLKKHVYELAEEIGERNFHVMEQYNQAADYIVDALGRNGFTAYEETFGEQQQFRNIIAEYYGTDLSEEVIVVGAHYDTVWLSPGADDNASGVAVLLELSRLLAQKPLSRTVRFIAFSNEEPPHYMRDSMGSLYHAKQSNLRNENIVAMISLEMLGYFSDMPNSQKYPKPFSYFYPDTANFIAFVSNFASRDLLRQSIEAFRDSQRFPAEGLAAPIALVPDVRRSDQAAFWRYGVKAFMVTDTAGFRNRAYHTVNDVPNSLNYEYMARITTGMKAVIEFLADH